MEADTCPTCSTPMEWQDCNACGGMRYIDQFESPQSHECQQCFGFGGWYVCPNRHNHPTEIDRTASDPAGTTPASTPATPPADCQQPRQRKEPL